MRIEIVKKVREQLQKLKRSDPKLALRMVQVVYQIGEDPYLKGTFKLTNLPQYRFRVGKFRILYRVYKKENLVKIISVAHRKAGNKPS